MHIADSTAAWLLLPGVLATTICAPLIGMLVDRVGTRLIIIGGLLLVLVGLAIYGLVPMSYTTFIVAGVIAGIGFAGLLGAPLRMILLNEARAEDRAATQGLLNVFLAIGQLMGAAIVGGVAESLGGGGEGYQSAFVVVACITGLLVVIALALKSRAAEKMSIAATTKAE